MNQRYVRKGRKIFIIIALCVVIFGNCVNVSASETTEETWFPVSVSTIENNYKILTQFSFEYDENGRLIQSPVKVSDLKDQMVDAESYLGYLQEWTSDYGWFDRKYCLSQVGYSYTYNQDGTVNEYPLSLSSKEIDSYPFESLKADYWGNSELEIKSSLAESANYECPNEYQVLEYTKNHLTSVTTKRYLNDDLWQKYLELLKLQNDDYYADVEYEYKCNKEEENTILDQLTYFYLAFGGIEVSYDDGRDSIRLNLDENGNSISYNIQNDNSVNYYNAYDEYGNLIYRVRYSDDTSVSYDSPLRESALLGGYEFKTETTTRNVVQIDMYTYAYGNPAEYSSNPDQFQLSICETPIAEILEALGASTDFSRSCTTESAFIENAEKIYKDKENEVDEEEVRYEEEALVEDEALDEEGSWDEDEVLDEEWSWDEDEVWDEE